ncbi:RBBP9/YdeN family alpha/beta hydrolase [Kocuria sp. KH4]
MHTATTASSAPMSRGVIVHGYAADPTRHWFPWLTDQLRATGVEVTCVALPDPAAPDATAWQQGIARVLVTPDEGTWVIAHSLGVITALRHLADLPVPWSLGGLVAVSGFIGTLPTLPVLDAFLATAPDLTAVAAHTGQRVVVRSDDDRIVPPAATDALATGLGAEKVVVPGAGHFLDEDGITALPALLPYLPCPAEPCEAPVHRAIERGAI